MLLNKTQLLDKNTPLSLRDISPGGGENTRPLSRITINCRFFSPCQGGVPAGWRARGFNYRKRVELYEKKAPQFPEGL